MLQDALHPPPAPTVQKIRQRMNESRKTRVVREWKGWDTTDLLVGGGHVIQSTSSLKPTNLVVVKSVVDG